MQSLITHARLFPYRVAGQADRFAALAEGQQPAVLFIACSDSRVMPALFTGARPGEIFELRTAGNIVPPFRGGDTCAVAATLEYAVQVLDVQDIVVCGHTYCGAVGALTNPDSLDRLPLVRQWLSTTDTVKPGDARTAGRHLQQQAEQHLVRQLAHARTYPFVADRLRQQLLRLHGWLYAIDTGEMTSYRADENRFVAL